MPDDLALVSAVSGALLPLVYPANWEQGGSMTPDEAAEIMSTAFDAFVSGDCGGDCPPPTIVYPDDTTGPIYRRNPTTDRWEILQADGTYVEPSGDEEIPDPTARGESTATDRQCAAATNAANLMHEIYSATLEQINLDVDTAELAVFLAGQAALYIGGVMYPPSLAAITISFGAFIGFAEVGQEMILSDMWDDHFNARYICCLKENSTDTSGVVTFDREAVNRCLLESIWTDSQYVLLVTMVIFMHSVIGEQGLNLLGTDTTLSGDCSHCGEWARDFDFRLGQMGWGPTTAGDVGTWNSAGYWDCVSGINTTLILTCNPPTGSGFTITRVYIEYYLVDTSFTAGNHSIGTHAPTHSVDLPQVAGWQSYDTGYTLSWDEVGDVTFRFFRNSGSMWSAVRRIRYYGTGTMPFSDLQGQAWYGS